MNRGRPLTALAVWCAVIGSIGVLGTHSAVRGAGGGRRPLAEADACRGIVTTSLSADSVRLCQPMTVTIQAEAMCYGCADGLNVVLVMQSEARVASAPWQVQAARQIVTELGKLPETNVDIGVVHYGDDGAKTALKLTDIGQSGAISGAIGGTRMGDQDSGAFVAAANQALRVLAEGRRTADGQSIRPCEVVVFFAYNVEMDGPGPLWLAAGVEMKKAANQLARSASTLVTICTTAFLRDPPASYACQHAREIAQSAGGWFAAPNSGSPSAEVVRAAVQAGHVSPLDVLSLVEFVSGGLQYLPGSGSPPPQALDASARETVVRWLRKETGATGAHTVTYAVKPLAEGRWPITGTLTITDTLGRSRIVPSRPVTITVSGLCDTPTARPSPSATPSATCTPTERPTNTPTIGPIATATASATPRALFLPLALVERCAPEHKRADVALVIDTSSSMAGRKLEDAKTAAATFVDQLDLAPGRDQVAIVRYDAEAEVACPLMNARAVIEAAIRNLIPVMILLTDGVQTGTPGEELRAAAEVRNAGVRLYTIGLGADADAAALREMAGDAARYHFAPDSADLARIYAEIASDILCPAPAGGFWPVAISQP
jgi:Mg-chelatase subunit ChlD